MTAAPRFLQALENHHDTGDGSYITDCPICHDILLIQPHDGTWELICDGECTHHELVRWLGLHDLRINPGWGVKAWVALMLAHTPDTWLALLDGEPVAEEALDQRWLRRFKAAAIV